MAKSSKDIADRLKQLYQLQVIDSKIDEIKILKGELPIEVSDLEDEIAGLEKRMDKLSSNIADIDAEISGYNAKIKESETLIERYNKQLEEVKNNREFEALTKEIELQKLEIQLCEKKIRDAQKIREAKTASLEAAQERKNVKEKNLAEKKVELERIIEKTNAEEVELQKQSDAAKETIDERLLKSYLRVRERYRNGIAVATIERDACGGCFNRIPPQIQIEIGQYKKIIACEHCGRVLIDDDIANAVHKIYETQEA